MAAYARQDETNKKQIIKNERKNRGKNNKNKHIKQKENGSDHDVYAYIYIHIYIYIYEYVYIYCVQRETFVSLVMTISWKSDHDQSGMPYDVFW